MLLTSGYPPKTAVRNDEFSLSLNERISHNAAKGSVTSGVCVCVCVLLNAAAMVLSFAQDARPLCCFPLGRMSIDQ